ncbi:GNAT family N-acetyltransferase [Leucobacter sp. OH2974_COT-288]|nr:GNAT family N-acetyltransferase [Leucobacter sp. OH2974_COT-288]
MQLTMIRPADEHRPGHQKHNNIRQLTENDILELGKLYFNSYPLGTVPNIDAAVTDIKAALAGEYGRFLPASNLVYQKDKEILGCVMVVDSPPWDDVANLVFVIDIFVEPKHRSKGIGKNLLQAALSAIPPTREVGLRVESENTAAVALYRSLGFVEVPVNNN